ncbi:hypothetical protein [Hymenobacter sp. YC55]|uniref:hypothetical protein n=1 Tax=Hymenobacter sp. YC55 TaxID=3034019 RepID=UPI0023F75316|nr:hypothetical protein [Hymenobacter sp. YC55]MDF7815117.1 hypothetical protein [Hymenobacter sp. YC55]
MQQPRESDLNFNQVKKDLNLVDLVLTLGYQHHRAKSGPSLERGKFHVFDYRGKVNLDQVIIYKAPSGDYLYFNRADDRDKGNVIDFIKYRIENPRIPGITASPGKSIWASVLDNARRFLAVPAQQRTVSPALQQAMEPVQRGDQYLPDFLLKTTPLHDTGYLNSRGISDEVLNEPCFKGRIFNHLHEGKRKDGHAYKVLHTAFPQLYRDKIVGLEIKTIGFKGHAADSLTSSALWLSHEGARTHTLVVSESALDSLSHFQLKRPNYTLYASTSGHLTDNQVTELRRLVTDQNLKTVKLAFGNNVEGHLGDTKLITGLAHPTAAMQIERITPGLLTVSIHCTQDQYFKKLHEETRSYNQRLTDHYHQVAGPERVGVSATLQDEFIIANKEADNNYKFHIPRRLDTLAFFNQALIQSYPMRVKLEVDKSRANDWNDQLKEHLKGKTAIQAPEQPEADEPSRRRGIRR